MPGVMRDDFLAELPETCVWRHHGSAETKQVLMSAADNSGISHTDTHRPLLGHLLWADAGDRWQHQQAPLSYPAQEGHSDIHQATIYAFVEKSSYCTFHSRICCGLEIRDGTVSTPEFRHNPLGSHRVVAEQEASLKCAWRRRRQTRRITAAARAKNPEKSNKSVRHSPTPR